MLLTVETVLILSSVGLFADLPGEALAEVAGATEEIEVAAGETIVAKGEYGDTMYIIVSGRFKVHDEDKEIAVLGEREVFGDLAALDPGDRVASVTALEDSLLLKMDHDSLYELITDNVEVAKNIIRFLVRRYQRPL